MRNNQAVDEMLNAELLSFGEIRCNFKSNRGAALAAYYITASNDKKVFSKQQMTYIVYDSKCIVCDGTELACSLKVSMFNQLILLDYPVIRKPIDFFDLCRVCLYIPCKCVELLG